MVGCSLLVGVCGGANATTTTVPVTTSMGSGDDDHRDVDDLYDGSDAAQAPDGLPIDVWRTSASAGRRRGAVDRGRPPTS